MFWNALPRKRPSAHLIRSPIVCENDLDAAVNAASDHRSQSVIEFVARSNNDCQDH